MENNDVRVEESSKLKFIILRRNHYCFFFTTRPLRAENSLNERPSEARGPNFPGIFSDFADDARFHFKMKICQMPTGRLRIDCMRLCVPLSWRSAVSGATSSHRSTFDFYYARRLSRGNGSVAYDFVIGVIVRVKCIVVNFRRVQFGKKYVSFALSSRVSNPLLIRVRLHAFGILNVQLLIGFFML